MSNFTTFFPSASGGEGAGINSYAAFLVGTTDNDPQGYIVSTGLYTNPVNNSVWLKTGKQIQSDGTTYPNATTGGFGIVGGTTTLPFVGNGIVWNGTNYLAIGNGDDLIHVFTEALVATGTTFSINATGNDVPRGLAFDGTHYYTGDQDKKVRKWTSSFGTVVSDFTASNINTFADLTILNGSIYVLEGNTGAGSKVRIYNSGGTETGDWGTSNIYNMGITNNGTNIFIAARNSAGRGTISGFTIAGVVTGDVVDIGNYTNRPQYVAYINGGYRFNDFSAKQNYRLFSESHGDATARTDGSGSAQQLFIKLK